ncbi:hypothetical protein [Hyphomonas sp.]|uniref:hypothetical protein n=1 Tax=Hyphomonas sp. TaxID=87 RepID=UPI003F7019F0
MFRVISRSATVMTGVFGTGKHLTLAQKCIDFGVSLGLKQPTSAIPDKNTDKVFESTVMTDELVRIA